MIRPLRKYHSMIWHLLAVMLPLCFIMAVVVRPSIPPTVRSEPGVIKGSIAAGTDSTDVVTIETRRTVTTPSCVVSLSTGDGEVVLGTVGQPGSYTFVTRKVELPATLKFWDAIHHRSLDSVALTEKK